LSRDNFDEDGRIVNLLMMNLNKREIQLAKTNAKAAKNGQKRQEKRRSFLKKIKHWNSAQVEGDKQPIVDFFQMLVCFYIKSLRDL
jgi:hypothetical protein